MPALSSPPLGTASPLQHTYLLAAAAAGALIIIFATAILLRRRRSQSPSPLVELEKAPLLPPSPSPALSSHVPSPPPYPATPPPAPVSFTPRRRSYASTTPDGTDFTGEIIVADGWRRHTKVFGGGVCVACQESERRLATTLVPAAP